jgi:hypothetical protein
MTARPSCYGALLVVWACAGACTPAPVKHPVASRPVVTPAAPPTRLVQLQLADGKPVAGALAKLWCDGTTRRMHTNGKGYLRVSAAGTLGCKLWLGTYWLPVPSGDTVLRLPAQLEVELLSDVPRPGRLVLDSRVASVHPRRWRGFVLTLRGERVLHKGRWLTFARSSALRTRDAWFPAFVRTRRSALFWGRSIVSRRLEGLPSNEYSRQARRLILRGQRLKLSGKPLLAPAHYWAASRVPNLPPPLRAHALLRFVSATLHPLLNGCNTPTPRLSLKEIAVREKRLAAKLVRLERAIAESAKGKLPSITSLARLESAAMKIAVACLQSRLYRNTPVPIKVARLGPRAVRSYEERVAAVLRQKLTAHFKAASMLLAQAPLSRLPALPKVPVPSTRAQLSAFTRAFERARTQLERWTKGGRTRKLMVSEVRRRAVLPVVLRGTPRGGEAAGVPLRTSAGLRKLSALLGKRRTLLVVSACHRDRRWLKALSKLAVAYHHIGLKVGAAAVHPCNVENAGRGYWLAGLELPWALEAQPDSVVVLDDKGAVLWRQKLADIGHAADAASAWLADNWAAFARAQRRGALPPTAALAKKLEKLHRRLLVMRAKRQWGRALTLAKRAAKLAPERVELQRRVAVMAGHARDLPEVERRRHWWRQRYGDLSSEVLLDHVRRKTGVPALPDPGRKKASSPPVSPSPAGTNR